MALTYGAFAAKHKITVASVRVDQNPFVDWEDATHWLVTLKRGRRTMSIYFSKEGADAPSVSAVLCCVAIDAQTTDGTNNFEEWANEYGRDADDNETQRAYDSCIDQITSLKRVLGDDIYNELLTTEEEDDI